jgi:serine/threonine protein kinase
MNIIFLGSTRNVIKKIMHIPTGFTLAGKFIPYPISLYENAEVRHNVKLIERELKIFRDMSCCSHIVDFYGFCLYEFKILIFMELMDFSLKDLYEKVYRNGTRFAEEFIGLVVISVLDAIQFCKSRKIMHRDIKPENILIHKQ